jgi:hypothetical protein
MRAAVRKRRLKQSLATEFRCHWSISMVREPTKTLHPSVHGALAFSRGASCSIKSRDPTDTRERSDDAFRHEMANSQCSEQK